MRSAKITHNRPISGFIPYCIARLWMRLFNWHVVGKVPAVEKFVLIGGPHTSSWDFPFTLATGSVLRLKICWMGKDTLFKKPFGVIMQWLGGVPIDRDARHGVVDQVVELFNTSKKLVMVMSPEGTRKKREYWKSGFYWIAQQAQIPILCGYLDFSLKEAGVGLCFVPTGNVKSDMDRIRDFYKGIQGKYPDLTSKIRLRDENIIVPKK